MIVYQKRFINLKKYLTKFNFKFLFFIILIINFFLLILLFLFGRQRLSQFIVSNKFKIKQKVSIAYHKATVKDLEHIDIDIKFEDWQKIKDKRQEALDKGILIASDEDFVKAQIRQSNKTIPVELRLKGDWTDHLEKNKWSFRVHVKGKDNFYNMRYFSLQDPQTRMNTNEWFFMQILKQEQLIALRYNFVDVSINGDHIGVYAIEEHFSKELIENNNRREGPILKFSEDRVWLDKLNYDFLEEVDLGQAYVSDIEVFKENKTLSDQELSNLFLEAERLLRLYRQGSIAADEVFDMDQWAKLFALSDVFNMRHGLTTHNVRFYYNPVTGLIEPIAFDCMIEKRLAEMSIEEDTLFRDFPEILKNKVFLEKYIKYLNIYSDKLFLENFITDIKLELDRVNKIINTEQHYQFSNNLNLFFINQAFIRKKITDTPAIRAQKNDQNQIEISALTELPVLVINKFDQEIFIPRASKTQVSEVIRVNAGDFDLEKISYKYLGLDQIYQASISPWIISTQDNRFKFKNYLPEFIYFDYYLDSYVIPVGSWQISSDLIIPSNKKLIISPNTKIDLVNNSAIIVKNAIKIDGSKNQPVNIYSSDNTGAGILVLNALEKSKISFTEFRNLANINAQSNNITGSVTFYNSDIDLNNTVFEQNFAEDQLNIINSEFSISYSSFNNSFSDAFDSDHSFGEILDSKFDNLTNDAIDASGSRIVIKNINISNPGDKAVSAGEKSKVEVIESSVSNAPIAYASKDNSELTVRLGTISDSQIGYVVYQKKPEYGPARIIIWNTLLSNIFRQWLIEKNSIITYNGNDYSENENNVYQRLLDNEFN
jgi:hypothetical protein